MIPDRSQQRDMQDSRHSPVCPRCGRTAVLRTAKLDARGRIRWQNPTRICVECLNEFSIHPLADDESIPF